ncbi:hypothetical protein SLS63_009968 [Diaporthe eres]|uniref:Uncharacterized protein n=1 Tax=Diaporthe eres TaxID=83184 RepID=A0ABR1NYD2_DIAER
MTRRRADKKDEILDAKIRRLREECYVLRGEKNRRILGAKDSGATINLDTAVLSTSDSRGKLRGARRMEAKKARLRAYGAQPTSRKSGRIWRILSPGDMQSFLSTLHRLLRCPWAADETWSAVAEALSGRPAARNIFLVDTETVIVGHEPKVLELAVLGADGRLAFSSTIDHGKAVSELCEGIGQQFLGYAIGIYRKDGTQ